MDLKLLLEISILLGIGLLGVFGLVAFAMPRNLKGERVRALPRGTRRVTQADLLEANDRAWHERHAVAALHRGGGL